MSTLDESIDHLLACQPYAYSVMEMENRNTDLLRELVKSAARNCRNYANYVAHWPVEIDSARTVSELPYLPVSVFKCNPPIALVPPEKFQRVMLSSSTTGQEPSRIAVDSATAKRMTKGVVSILRDFIGSDRRPYLVVDTEDTNSGSANLGARGAAIRALAPFATDTLYCLKGEKLEIDIGAIKQFAEDHGDKPVLIYGFTSILWNSFVKPLLASGVNISLPHAYVLHSGGWKKLISESVSKDTFNNAIANLFGSSTDKIIDYYGMVENLGIIYPDCSAGNKHAPSFGTVIIRDPLTLKPVATGETGIVQVCSVLPTSFPGHLLLTEDLATLVAHDNCPCGRPGTAFRFAGRIAKAEVRGCGNIDRQRTA
jgi:phenylacetate-coenzyme A ligase PaaK-like adenylate-forming protein